MQLHITDEAIRCLKEDWDFTAGEFVKVYVRYAGGGGDPYKIGILKERPDASLDDSADVAVTSAGDITFYMFADYHWILEGGDLTIDAEGEELQFVVENSE